MSGISLPGHGNEGHSTPRTENKLKNKKPEREFYCVRSRSNTFESKRLDGEFHIARSTSNTSENQKEREKKYQQGSSQLYGEMEINKIGFFETGETNATMITPNRFLHSDNRRSRDAWGTSDNWRRRENSANLDKWTPSNKDRGRWNSWDSPGKHTRRGACVDFQDDVEAPRDVFLVLAVKEKLSEQIVACWGDANSVEVQNGETIGAISIDPLSLKSIPAMFEETIPKLLNKSWLETNATREGYGVGVNPNFAHRYARHFTDRFGSREGLSFYRLVSVVEPAFRPAGYYNLDAVGGAGCGHVALGESLWVAARRETLEECGIMLPETVDELDIFDCNGVTGKKNEIRFFTVFLDNSKLSEPCIISEENIATHLEDGSTIRLQPKKGKWYVNATFRSITRSVPDLSAQLKSMKV